MKFRVGSELIELPFKLLVVGQYSSQGGEEPVESRQVRNVNLHNFDDVLKAHNVVVRIRVKNHLNQSTPGPDSLISATLRISSLADFTPDNVVPQIPEFGKHLALRSACQDWRTELCNRHGSQRLLAKIKCVFRELEDGPGPFGSTEHPPVTLHVPFLSESGTSSIDTGVLDGDEISETTARELLIRIARKVSESGGRLTAGTFDEIMHGIDLEISRQMDEVLHHPEVQRLESAWRALYFLVERCDFQRGIKISVLDVSKDDLIKDFEDAPDVTRSGFYAHVFSSGLGMFGGTPVSAVIGEYHFGPGPRDNQLLSRIAAVCTAANAPFIAAASPALLGLESFLDLLNLRNIEDVFSEARFAQWRALRSGPGAEYLGLTLPRFLARSPYSAGEVKRFAYDEEVSSNHEHYLWANAAFALAARLTVSFATSGWFRESVGPTAGRVPVPGELSITARREYELQQNGFISLVTRQGGDYSAFFGCASVRKLEGPAETPVETSVHLTRQLPFLLSVSRLLHHIRVIRIEYVGRELSAQEMERIIQGWLDDNVNDTAGAVRSPGPFREATVTISDHGNGSNSYIMRLELTLRGRDHSPPLGPLIVVQKL